MASYLFFVCFFIHTMEVNGIQNSLVPKILLLQKKKKTL